MFLHKILAATLFLACLSVGATEAAVRNYFAPALDGTRLDACLSNADDCGKPAADAFCKVQGYRESVLFQREPVNGSRRLGSGESCEGSACIGFRQIKCYQPQDNVAALPAPSG